MIGGTYFFFPFWLLLLNVHRDTQIHTVDEISRLDILKLLDTTKTCLLGGWTDGFTFLYFAYYFFRSGCLKKQIDQMCFGMIYFQRLREIFRCLLTGSRHFIWGIFRRTFLFKIRLNNKKRNMGAIKHKIRVSILQCFWLKWNLSDEDSYLNEIFFS